MSIIEQQISKPPVLPTTDPRPRRWTTREYYRIGEIGLFQGQSVELIEGEILQMSPHGVAHATGISLAEQALRRILGDGVYIRGHLPLDLGSHSEPEPDIAVVSGTPRDYISFHPRTALLIVEISESSLAFDCTTKANLYAKGGIADFWIVNLIDRQIEVYRDPIEDAAAALGHRFADVKIYKQDDSIVPFAFPAESIAVRDLLP